MCSASEISGRHGGQDELRVRKLRISSPLKIFSLRRPIDCFCFGVGCFLCWFVFWLCWLFSTMVIHLSALDESSDSQPDASDRLTHCAWTASVLRDQLFYSVVLWLYVSFSYYPFDSINLWPYHFFTLLFFDPALLWFYCSLPLFVLCVLFFGSPSLWLHVSLTLLFFHFASLWLYWSLLLVFFYSTIFDSSNLWLYYSLALLVFVSTSLLLWDVYRKFFWLNYLRSSILNSFLWLNWCRMNFPSTTILVEFLRFRMARPAQTFDQQDWI